MPPVIPAPQQPKAHARQPLMSTACAAMQAKATAEAQEEDQELDKILQYVEKEIKRMASKFDKSECYYHERLHFQVRMYVVMTMKAGQLALLAQGRSDQQNV